MTARAKPPTQVAYAVCIDHGEGRLSLWREVFETRALAARAINNSMAVAEPEMRPRRMTAIEVRIVPMETVLMWPAEPEPTHD